MAKFRISTRPAKRSYTDNIPFVTVAFGRSIWEYNIREFEATKLEQIKEEVKNQEKMVKEPSVTLVKKISGRAPIGFNKWDEKWHFFEPFGNSPG